MQLFQRLIVADVFLTEIADAPIDLLSSSAAKSIYRKVGVHIRLNAIISFAV